MLPKEPKITNSDYQKYQEVLKTINGVQVLVKEENPHYAEILKQQQSAITKKQGTSYYIVKRKDGGKIDTAKMFKKSIQDIIARYDIITVEPTLINKLNTKITLANTIDGQFIRSLITYINREKSSLPIDAVISLITKCLYDSLNAEAEISLLKDAGITQMINELKQNKVEKIPDNLFEAIVTKKLFKYLKIKIMNEWIGNDNTQSNLQKVAPFQ